MQIYLNDGLVSARQARVSVFDHGFLYGDGIYETMRVYDGVVYMLDEHIRRLQRSALFIGLDLPKDPDQIKVSVYETLEANGHRDAYLRLTVSRGEGPVGLDPELCPRPTYLVITEPLRPYPRKYYEEGIKLYITATLRNHPGALDPRIKSLNFLNNILAKIEAKRARADEALMTNYRGQLAEGTVSNLFFVTGGNTLCTPSVDCGILDGITRNVVASLAGKFDIKLEEGFFTPEDLYEAKEVFITSTIMEVMPVGAVFSSQKEEVRFAAGEITKLMQAEYRKDVEAYVKDAKERGPSIWGQE